MQQSGFSQQIASQSEKSINWLSAECFQIRVFAMMLAKVIGTVIASAKYPPLQGHKLLLIQPITKQGATRGRPLVAVDAVGAGVQETVYWCRGREASLALEGEVPTDAAIIGIVDQITGN